MYSRSYNKLTSCTALALLAMFALPTSAIAGEPAVSGDVTVGKTLYSQTCIACHGANGKGAIPGVSNLASSDGPLAKSDEELAKSIRDGLATPGAALTMPAKGGNPSLSDDDILSLIAFLRSEFGG